MRQVRPACLLVAAVAVVYLNAFRGAFQFDDYNVIVDNPAVHGWPAFLSGLTHGIRPVLKFTYALNWTSGLGLFGFHLVNVALHAANAVLALRLAATRSIPRGPGFAAVLTAFLFAVHPVQTEAVTYVSGRSVSLMALFYLASVLTYLRGRERDNAVLTHVVSPLLFALSVLAKEVALTLPFALALCEAVSSRETGGRTAFRAQAVHWVLLALAVVAMVAHSGYGRLLEACFGIRGAAANLLTQVHGISYLLSRVLSPAALNIDPDLPVLTDWTRGLAVEASLLGGLLAAGVVCAWKRPVAGFGVLWFFLHLVPTNSFIPRLDVANERQLYLGSWGLFLAFADGLSLLRARVGGRWVTAAATALVMALAGATVSRNRVYRDEIALWEDTARKSPGKARPHNNLGFAYEQAGRFREAEAAYRRALRIDPAHGFARENLRSARAKAARLRAPGDAGR